MKKIILSLLLTFCFVNVFAGDHNAVRLISGSTDVFNESATAILEFDYSETTWEEDEIYELYCGDDFQERVNVSEKAFEKKFNITSKGMKIKNEDSGAKYKIVFKIVDLEQHQSMSMWGRMTMEVTGQIDVIEISSGKSVCCLQLTKVQGEADYATNDRITKLFCNVADRILIGKIKK
ncbi:MAG: hypothetical protein K6F33_13850 [Bacteroidales bacterium]|nr:hypothetical protein [Bacteroidales bacterium]